MFIDDLQAFGDGLPDADYPVISATPSAPAAATMTAPSAASTIASPSAADTCGDWYKFLYDHFEIYGKNFDGTKFGSDGSGLKSQIKGMWNGLISLSRQFILRTQQCKTDSSFLSRLWRLD